VLRVLLRKVGGFALAIVALAVGYLLVLQHPDLLFTYYTQRGRLELFSDQPFDPARAQALLADVDARLAKSTLNDANVHRIFICNADWRQRLLFNRAYGAGGVNFYPLTRNVFIRNADVDTGTVYGASGKPAEYPRTLAYFAAHEIGHTLTGEYLGVAHLWNWRLPVSIREGTADYIGFGRDVDLNSLEERYRAHDPDLDPKSGHYDLYRMEVSNRILTKHETLQQVLSAPAAIPPK
jgi:hypothetical protein